MGLLSCTGSWPRSGQVGCVCYHLAPYMQESPGEVVARNLDPCSRIMGWCMKPWLPLTLEKYYAQTNCIALFSVRCVLRCMKVQ